MAAPIEAKAQAAGIAGAVAGIVLWALQTWAFKGTAVPAGLQSLVDAAVPGVLAVAGAWWAPHTPRPGPAVTLPQPTQETGNVAVQPPKGTM